MARKKTELTEKQRRFVDEYVKTGNATQAAINAGYKPGPHNQQAKQTGASTLAKAHVQKAIQARLKKMESKRIADATEVLEYLTAVMRGESQGNELVVEGQGPGISQAREVRKKPSEAERLKAAGMLSKRYDLHMTTVEYNIRLERLQLENEKLKAEIDRLNGGTDEDINDGFIEALNATAAKDWADE